MSKEKIRRKRKSAEKVEHSAEKKKGKKDKSKSGESVQKSTSAEKANPPAEAPGTSTEGEKRRAHGFLGMLTSLRIKKKKSAEKIESDEKIPEKADSAGTDSKSQEKGARRFKHMLSSIWDRKKTKAEKEENVGSAEEKADSAEKAVQKTSTTSNTAEKTGQTSEPSKTDTDEKEKPRSGSAYWEKRAQKKLEKDEQRDVAERAVEIDELKTMRLPEKSLMNKPKATPEKSLEVDKTLRSKSLLRTVSSTTPDMKDYGVLGYGATGKGIVQPMGSKRVQNVKRFFFRIKETIGMTEKTEVSKAFKDSLAHLDKYKICLDTLAEAVCGTIQENPSYRKEDHKMEMAPPANEEEHEMVAKYLESKTDFNDYTNQKKLIDLYMKLGNEKREYIRRGRRSLHNIRTFIQYHYWVIAMRRNELEKLRREMDFAKSELKGAKEPQLIAYKNKLYQEAVTAFQIKLRELTTLLDQVPQHKESHVADLLEWCTCTKKFHEEMAHLAEACEKPP
ncbi:unnamed protein product [Cylicocyclus nassatus]|uniref:BAR domain-containing protein n=1 Tax=Cylicocyclus nassatus TaxID=53992 RepID=A0AA36DUB1_CYLNA|nr:unnamed protein product [Cylicocyclus nassatus]